MLLRGLRCSVTPRPPVVQGGSENISEALSRTVFLPLPLYMIDCENLLPKNRLKRSGHDNVVDPTMWVWCCEARELPILFFRGSKTFHKRRPKKYQDFSRRSTEPRCGFRIYRILRRGEVRCGADFTFWFSYGGVCFEIVRRGAVR